MHPLSLTIAGSDRQLDPWRPWTVGSSQYADVRIDLPGVQDIHLILRWSGSSWIVEDRGSSTGTAFNGYRLMAYMAAIIDRPAQVTLAPDSPRAAPLQLAPRLRSGPAEPAHGEQAPDEQDHGAQTHDVQTRDVQDYGLQPPGASSPARDDGPASPDDAGTDLHPEDLAADAPEPTVLALPVENAARRGPSAPVAQDALHPQQVPAASEEATVYAVSMNRDPEPGDDEDTGPEHQPAVEAEQRSWVNRPDHAEVRGVLDGQELSASGMRLSPAFRGAQAGGSLVIGRDPTCDVLIDGLLVSRRHARLTRTEGGSTITDLGSTNGTWVDGRRISATTALLPGTRAVIGGVPFLQTEAGLAELVRSEGNMSIVVQDLSFSVPDRANPQQPKTLVDDVSLQIPDRSLVAVIGPSGAGKSTLLNCLLGDLDPDRGRIEYHGLDLAQFGAALSSQIGMVPQEDVLHRELTAQQVLESTAALRLPEDVDARQRRARIDSVLDALGLSEHARTPVSQLSGGQRKRVSTAMELLTGPRYLFLDEPTSGLDPDMDFEVMDLLRRMAHGEVAGSGGSTVVVITHSTANLDLADRVLVLAPGGSVAYFGEPAGMMPYFERSQDLGPQVREVYKGLKDDPARAAVAFRRESDDDAPREKVSAQRPSSPPHASSRRGLFQLGVLLRRQLQLMRTDAVSVVVTTVVAPALLALLVLVVPGEHGLSYPESSDPEFNQPQILLIVILLAAVALGLFPACRTFLDEKRIFLREARTGLGVWPYVGAKTLLTIAATLVQSLILVAAVLALIPNDPVGSWGPMWLELWIVTFLLSLTSWLLGFLVSALVARSDVAMNAASLLVVVQLIFCGGLFAMEGATDGISRAVPTRWAYAAMAQSGDLNEIVRTAAVVTPQEEADRQAQEDHTEAVEQARAQGAPEPPPLELPAIDESAAVLDPLWHRGALNWWGAAGATAGFGLVFLLVSVLLIQRVKRRKR